MSGYEYSIPVRVQGSAFSFRRSFMSVTLYLSFQVRDSDPHRLMSRGPTHTKDLIAISFAIGWLILATKELHAYISLRPPTFNSQHGKYQICGHRVQRGLICKFEVCKINDYLHVSYASTLHQPETKLILWLKIH